VVLVSCSVTPRLLAVVGKQVTNSGKMFQITQLDKHNLLREVSRLVKFTRDIIQATISTCGCLWSFPRLKI